ncbi:uncharacterized protein LOC123297850 [Chrysoperla carnea]|uniref:uncharacterized protein LOC123297850 n=1 Tax=Chrysoperla carnea TaxID=189513 RepID=UPI001D08DFEC|nr:uncharacterized protein LOC123297850 [Chrysoperla carnea]
MSSKISNSDLLEVINKNIELKNEYQTLQLKVLRQNCAKKLIHLNDITETLLKAMQNIITYKHQIANETEPALVSISENINLQISSTLSSTNREEFRQLMAKFLYLSNHFEENIKIIQDSPKEDIYTNIAKNQWFKWIANFRRLEKIIGSVDEYHNMFKAMSQETEENIHQSTMNNDCSTWEDLGVKAFPDDIENMSPIEKNT